MTVITGNRVRRSMSSSESRRQEVTEQACYAVEDCFRSVTVTACSLQSGWSWAMLTHSQQPAEWLVLSHVDSQPAACRLAGPEPCWLLQSVWDCWTWGRLGLERGRLRLEWGSDIASSSSSVPSHFYFSNFCDVKCNLLKTSLGDVVVDRRWL